MNASRRFARELTWLLRDIWAARYDIFLVLLAAGFCIMSFLWVQGRS